MASCSPVLDPNSFHTKRRRNPGAQVKNVFIWAFWAFWSLLIGAEASGSSNKGVGVPLFISALTVQILIHELGHLVAGWLVGFRFSFLSAGPLRLRWQNGKLGMSILRERTALGDTGMRVVRVARLRRRLVFFGLGGVVANALSLAVALTVANRSSFVLSHPLAMSFAVQFAFISTVLLFVNVNPGPKGSRSVSDGSCIADLMSDRKRARRDLALCGVRSQNHQGIRPRDWRQTWLKAACSVRDGSFDDFLGNWFAYGSAVARSDKHEANAHLEICLRLSNLQTQDIRQMLAQEAAFFSAWFLRDPHLADRWIAKAEARHPMLFLTRVRLDIATHCGRNEFCQAWRLWEEAIIGFQALPEVGVKRTLLGDWLDFGNQILVRETEAASGSVPVVKTHSSDLYDKLRTSSPDQIRNGRVPVRQLIPYWWTSMLLSFLALVMLATTTSHTIWVSRAVAAILYSSWVGLLWMLRRYVWFDTLRGPGSGWYSFWNTARFQMTENALIFVRDIDSVTPWYVEKVGLCRALHIRSREYDVATYKFKADGKSVTLTTRMLYGTGKTLRLFTKRIGKMERILSARGIKVGPINRDIQGTRYFEIHDPEGNVIEVVQDF